MLCKGCKKLLFESDDIIKGVIKIKHSRTKEYTFDLNGEGAKLKEPYKKVKRGKCYFFDIIRSEETIIKIMCENCKRFYIINLDKGTSIEVQRNHWSAVGVES